MVSFSSIFISSIVLLVSSIYGQTICDESYECLSTTVTDDIISCSGYYACSASQLQFTSELLCIGARACDKAVFDGQSAIAGSAYCNGYFACSEAKIGFAYDFVSDGDNAFVDGTGYFKYVSCNGYEACAYSVFLSARHIVSYGDASMHYTVIDSSSVPHLKINFGGYRSGRYSLMYCRGGSNCTLECGCEESCDYSEFLCYSGATCNIECTSSCPTVYYITNTGSDSRRLITPPFGFNNKNNKQLLIGSQLQSQLQNNVGNSEIKYINNDEADTVINKHTQQRDSMLQDKHTVLNKYVKQFGNELGTVKFTKYEKEQMEQTKATKLTINRNTYQSSNNDINTLLVVASLTGIAGALFGIISAKLCCVSSKTEYDTIA